MFYGATEIFSRMISSRVRVLVDKRVVLIASGWRSMKILLLIMIQDIPCDKIEGLHSPRRVK